jgi:hypothetical protein
VPLSGEGATLGQLSVIGGRLRLIGGWLPALGPGRLRIEGSLGAGIWRASASGLYIFHTASSWAGVPVAGIRAGYQWDLPGKFWLTALADGQLALGLASFDVQGVSEDVTTPRWQGGVTLGVGRSFL